MTYAQDTAAINLQREKLFHPERYQVGDSEPPEVASSRCKAIAARWYQFPFPKVPGERTFADPIWNIPVVKLADDGSEDRYASAVCKLLYRRFPDVPFAACIRSDESWLLGSDEGGNNTDVGAIAKARGGGGCRNAAHFRGDVVNTESIQHA